MTGEGRRGVFASSSRCRRPGWFRMRWAYFVIGRVFNGSFIEHLLQLGPWAFSDEGNKIILSLESGRGAGQGTAQQYMNHNSWRLREGKPTEIVGGPAVEGAGAKIFLRR